MNKKRTSSQLAISQSIKRPRIGRTITIVGRSRVGTSIAEAILADTNYELQTHVAARSKRYPQFSSDVLFIAAKDDKISGVAQKAVKCGSPKLIVHFAGSLPSTVLPATGALRLTLHPIQTFATSSRARMPEPHKSFGNDKSSGNLFQGVTFMASSEEPAAISWAKAFVRSIGGKGVIEVEPEHLVRYHTMMVFAANFQVLLAEAVEEISLAIGQNPAKMKLAMRPLMEQVLKNVMEKPANEVLTGPIRRKDFATIRNHQKALTSLDPKLRKLYDAFLDYANG